MWQYNAIDIQRYQHSNSFFLFKNTFLNRWHGRVLLYSNALLLLCIQQYSINTVNLQNNGNSEIALNIVNYFHCQNIKHEI